ncbi:MAG: helix-turn-helix domain-containing protein [Phycisphaerae bacterium]
MNHNTSQFGIQPAWPVFDGIVSKLPRSAIAVWAVLVVHSRDGLAWPGKQRIARLAGIHARTAGLAINRLVGEGLISIVKNGCGRGNKTVYRIVQKQGAHATYFNERDTRRSRKVEIHDPKKGVSTLHIEQEREQQNEHTNKSGGACDDFKISNCRIQAPPGKYD